MEEFSKIVYLTVSILLIIGCIVAFYFWFTGFGTFDDSEVLLYPSNTYPEWISNDDVFNNVSNYRYIGFGQYIIDNFDFCGINRGYFSRVGVSCLYENTGNAFDNPYNWNVPSTYRLVFNYDTKTLSYFRLNCK